MSTDFINLVSGFASGATGVFASQPLYNIKLDQQKGKMTHWKIHCLYAGLGAAIPGDAACVAVQNSVFQRTKGLLSERNAALLGGAFSAIPLTTCEILMDHHRQNIEAHSKNRQMVRPTYLTTIKKLVAQNGPLVLFRGIKCTMGREAINTMAWTLWSHRITQAVEPYASDPLLSRIAGGMLSGLIAAGLSHPLDTAKVNIQNHLKTGYLHEDMLKTIKKSCAYECQKNGRALGIFNVSHAIAKEAFLGIKPRAGVQAIFITTITLCNEYYSKGLKSIVG